MRRSGLLASAVISLLAFTGCGADSADGLAVPGSQVQVSTSFLSDYLAAQSVKAVPPTLLVTGDWFGVAFCPSGPFPVTVTVGDVQSSVSVLPALGDPRRTTPFHSEHVERSANLTYELETQILSLIAQAPATTTSDKARGLQGRLLLAPNDSGQAIMSVSETGEAATRVCKSGIAGRGESVAVLKRFAKRLETIRLDSRPVIQQQCPASYAQWLATAVTEGKAALLDKGFAETFGSSYLAVDAESLLNISAVLSGSCVGSNRTRKDMVAQLRAAAMLRDYRTYEEVFRTAFRDRVALAWVSWANDRIRTGAIAGLRDASSMRLLPQVFDLIGHPAFEDFDARIAAGSSALNTASSTEEFVRRIEDQRTAFRQLLAIELQAQVRDDIDLSTVAIGLDYYLDSAAAGAAQAVRAPEDAAFLASWAQQQQHGARCPAANDATCVKSAATIRAGLANISKVYAQKDDDDFKTLLRGTDGLEQLFALVSFERQFRERYGALADYTAFKAGIENRRKQRLALQHKLREQLRVKTASVNTEPSLRALVTDYFLDDELMEQPELRERIDARLRTTRPFSEMAGGDYMNALYNRDFARLRDLDRRYLAGILPIMRFGLQQATMFGPLIDAIADRQAGSAEAEIFRASQNLTALYAVMGTYLVNFQDIYSDCLRPGAPMFTIETRTDTVTRDRLGNEIQRQPGWISSDSYRVNQEFAGQFQALFNAATGSAQAQLLDLFLNDAGVARLRASTRQLMEQNACNTATIRQFEQGLLAFDARLRGVDRPSAGGQPTRPLEE